MAYRHTSERRDRADDRITPSYLDGFLERVEPLAAANRMRFERIRNLEDSIDKLLQDAEATGLDTTRRAATKGVPLDTARKSYHEFIQLQMNATELSAKKLELAKAALSEVDEIVTEFDGRLADFEAQLRREGRFPTHHHAAHMAATAIGEGANGLNGGTIVNALSARQAKPRSSGERPLSAKAPRGAAATAVAPAEGETGARSAALRPGSSIASMDGVLTSSEAGAFTAGGASKTTGGSTVGGMLSVAGGPGGSIGGTYSGAAMTGAAATRGSQKTRRGDAGVGTGAGGSGAPTRSGGLPPRAASLKASKAANAAATMSNSGEGDESSDGDKADVIMEPATDDGEGDGDGDGDPDADGDGDGSAMNDGSAPDMTIYCSCRSISHGEMIACEGKTCPYEWYHFACVGLTAAPPGVWLCPTCRDKTRRKTGAGRRKHH